jgi:aspartyl protease family protein
MGKSQLEKSQRFLLRLFQHRQVWVGLLSLWVMATALPAVGQLSTAQLEEQLQAAVAQSNWSQALQIVDRLIPLAPEQAKQLRQYRIKLEQLSRETIARPPQPISASQPQGFVAIKRRSGGVPVIDVVFNQRRTFEMMVDSGASITTITRPMARALGIGASQIVDRVTFKTANGLTQMPIVYLNAVTVGGLTKAQVPVAIAGSDMEMGLLGQDFLQHYDVSLRGSRIEFHDRR